MSPTDPDNAPDAGRTLVGSLRARETGGAKFGKAQKQFNRLVAEAEDLRAMLAHWHACLPALEQRIALEIEPLVTRYHKARVRLVMLLHEAIESGQLSKREKLKASEIVRRHLEEIPADDTHDRLAALHEQYGVRKVDEAPPGDDDPADETGRSRTGEQDQQRAAGAHAAPAPQTRRARGASAAVRDIYRRLASALHPDREPDERERLRKTALMQQANQAYADTDLLTLLGLQLKLDQLDEAALQALARERLMQFNDLLTEQCRQLRRELTALMAPFTGGTDQPVERLTPAAVERALEREARELKRAARECEADIVHFRHIHHLQAALDHYRLGDVAPENR